MIISKVKNIILWYNSNLGNVDNLALNYKLLFLGTNAIYFFIPYYFNLDLFYTFLFCSMGTISTIFHGHQCCNQVCRKNTQLLMWSDVVLTSTIGTIIIFLRIYYVNYIFFISFLFSLYFYYYGTNKLGPKQYIFYHGMWHILTGVSFITLF